MTDLLLSLDEFELASPGVVIDPAQAELILAIASDTVRGFTAQALSLVEGDRLVLRGAFGPSLWLPERPVLAVSSIEFEGQAVAAETYRWDSEGRVTFSRSLDSWVNGPSGLAGGSWGGDERFLAVTYDHGFDPVPADIKGVCLALARRSILTPDAGAISQESLGSYSVSYSRESAATLTAGEERTLRRYRRRQATVLAR